MKRFVYAVLAALLIVFTLTSCNDKKDDPLYIDALSFLYDEGNGKIEIENTHQDVYLKVGDQSFYTDFKFYVDLYKNNEYKDVDYFFTQKIYDKYYEGRSVKVDYKVLSGFLEAGTVIKLFTTSSKYKYEIIRYPDMYPFVCFGSEKYRFGSDDNGEMHYGSSLNLKNGEEFFAMGQIERYSHVPGYGPFYYDITGCFDGSKRIKVLNADITIDSITNINPETNTLFADDCVLIKVTYQGEDGVFSFDEVTFVVEDV